MKRGIFLDRDGVINQAFVVDGKPIPPKNLNEVVVLPGTIEALRNLRDNNFEIIVVTNQPDVARGVITPMTVNRINKYLEQKLKINHFYTCFHDDVDGCNCRKPKPGLLLNATRALNLDLKSSVMIGDRWRDISAGQAAGCKCFYIDCGYKEKSPLPPFIRVSSLLEASRIILEKLHD
jgi:D-glycero-D-manno-heptose 1,7-bisphosphate phosphatase